MRGAFYPAAVSRNFRPPQFDFWIYRSSLFQVSLIMLWKLYRMLTSHGMHVEWADWILWCRNRLRLRLRLPTHQFEMIILLKMFWYASSVETIAFNPTVQMWIGLKSINERVNIFDLFDLDMPTSGSWWLTLYGIWLGKKVELFFVFSFFFLFDQKECVP